MIDFNEVPTGGGGGGDFELIPAGTVARVILTMKRGSEVIPDYSTQPMFKQGQTGTKWLECEFTVVGGKYDKRKFWQNIMVDGGKINPESGMPWCKEIGIRTFRDIINSTFGLDPNDTSPEAAMKRKVNDLNVLDGAEFCVKVAVEKGTNGYADKNKMMVALAVNSNEYIGSAQAPQTNNQQPQQPNGNSPLPPWAKK
jgi:hypothetical protein|tara:strand:+ start:1928 stop:2521 length:594 start_codon:yes stop_codon:yes gene_type:complete